MNFQGINRIENQQAYLDAAFRKAREKADSAKEKLKKKKGLSRMVSARIREQARLQTIRSALASRLSKILESFPKIDELPEFYRQLVKVTLDYPTLKKSLGGINWAVRAIERMSSRYEAQIARSRETGRIAALSKEYFGRVSSIMRQIGPCLETLESSRRVMKGYPAVKTSLFTVALFGFPNVGKTTILYRLTGSSPDIDSYAFTTKRINIGYFRAGDRRIQVLDTPGTLARFSRMNRIEKQAHLAVKHCADLVVYVMDLTEPYPLPRQEQLLQQLRKDSQKVVVYLSKADILDNRLLERHRRRGAIESAGKLKKEIIRLSEAHSSTR